MADKPKGPKPKTKVVANDVLECRECGASPVRRGDEVAEGAVEYTCCKCIVTGRKRDAGEAEKIKATLVAVEANRPKLGADILNEEKYGPMRKVVKVVKELTPKSVQVLMECGHERSTPKTMAKQCRCPKCRQAKETA